MVNAAFAAEPEEAKRSEDRVYTGASLTLDAAWKGATACPVEASVSWVCSDALGDGPGRKSRTGNVPRMPVAQNSGVGRGLRAQAVA
jgi:hypothetical protein